jgi:hypothetical protein
VVWGPVVRGIDGRPRSAARQRHGRACWVPRRRRGASPSPCRLRRARRLSGAQQDDGTGEVSGGRAAGCSWPGSERQGSGAASARGARSSACSRAQSREGRVSEREERERGVERERKKKCQRFDLVQTHDFQLKLEKF